MTTLWQDILYGCRMLRNRPAFTIAAVLSLALGIGANTTIFSVINGTLLSTLPYERPDRLVVIWQAPVNSPGQQGAAHAQNYRAWRTQSKSFSEVGAVYGRTSNLTGGENGVPAQRVDTRMIAWPTWKVLGVKPLLGRVFTEEEDQDNNPAPVAVLTYDFWQTNFGGKKDVIGHTFVLDDAKTTIIGVMPKGFRWGNDDAAMFIPMGFSPQQLTSRATFLIVPARLKDGVSIQQAKAEMLGIAKGLAQTNPDLNKDVTVNVEPILQAFYGDDEEAMLVLQFAVVFVLLIACANVAGLLLARAAARGTEVAVRGALGAGRGRLIRQMLTESVILSLLGGVLGAVLGWAGLRMILAALGPGQLSAELGIDFRVLVFTAAVSLATGLLFGLAPALQASKVDFVTTLKEAGRTGMEGGHKQRVRSVMVAAQVALALILLIGAGLMMTSFLKVRSNPLGMDVSNVQTFEFQFGQNQLMKAVGRYRGVGLWEIFPNVGQTYQRIYERVQTIPGVKSAAAISRAPASGSMQMGFLIAGQPAPDPNTPGGNPNRAAYFGITPRYFETMKIPVMNGRDFNDRDTATGAPVIIVSKAFADKWFPGQAAIGQRIRLDFVPDEPMREVVGVVGDTRGNLYQANFEPAMYIPHLQQSKSWQGPSWGYRAMMAFVLRTSGDPDTLVPAIRNAVAEVDSSKPAANIRTIESRIDRQMAGLKVFTILLSIFGTAAALLAAIGIYGVMAYAVEQRTREIGVRMALGARAPNVLGLVARQVLLLVLGGMIVGLAGAYGLTRFLVEMLWNTSPTDPVMFASVAVGLLAVSIVACLIPTRRAMKVDPAIALRYE